MRIPSFDGEELAVTWLNRSSHPTHSFILLHGVGGDSQSLIPLAESIKEFFTAAEFIIIDQRGHGKSSKKFPKQISSYEEYLARDIAAMSKYATGSHLVIIGHSLGSIALQTLLSLQLTSQPITPIFICPPPKAIPIPFFNRHQWFAHSKNWGNKMYHHQLSVAEHLKLGQTHDFNPLRIWHDIMTTGPMHWLSAYGSLLGWRTRLTPANTPPGLVILGEHDALLPIKNQRQFWGHLPSLTVTTVAGNHICVFTHYREIATMIKEYVEKRG